tara:strand:+ start:9023 stop:9814 length:792 start_codon:yes stop_codon:yes gene_type:complete
MIGLIFGETEFPRKILKKIKNKKKYLIIDLSKNKNFKNDKNSYSVELGQFGKIIKLLKENKCKKILFAGKVKRPIFSQIRLDLKGVYYMPRLIKCSKLGDAAILKEIINIFKIEKIKTISSLFYNPELSLKKGNYTKIKPNIEDKRNIKKAIITLNKIGKYNFSQGVVVRNKKVEAIEGKNGTQKMLKECITKKNINKGVLVKFPKKKQDIRIDLPTVGIKTFKQCKLAKIKGIVLKNKLNVFLERKKCISYANKNRMFILVQ